MPASDVVMFVSAFPSLNPSFRSLELRAGQRQRSIHEGEISGNNAGQPSWEMQDVFPRGNTKLVVSKIVYLYHVHPCTLIWLQFD